MIRRTTPAATSAPARAATTALTTLAALITLAGLCATAVQAQQTVHYRAGETIDPEDVARVLAAPAPSAAPVRTRSIRLLVEGGADASAAPTGTPAAAAGAAGPTSGSSSLSVPVQFAFGSANIMPTARAQLDAIAAGIQLLPPERRLVVEGHTDAVGSDAVNRVLSQQRAAAVKHYLVTQHGIAPQRLQEVGHGPYRPIDGLAPTAPENRRVQFRGA